MNYKHGQSRKNKQSSEYRMWAHMKERCNNPNDKDYKNYGERGIMVWPSWNDFRKFYTDVGKRPKGMTFDRINNNGSYWPGNWRWATSKEQAANTRNLHWFYGYGPNGEMIIEDNQSRVARMFNLSQTGISQCLLSKHSAHKGWKFQWIK